MNIKLILAILFLIAVIMPLQASAQAFSADSIYSLSISKPIYSLSINADITLKSDNSLVRVILVDKNGTERLVYEAYPLIASSKTFSVTSACQETCAMDSVTASLLKIQIVDATLNIKNINSVDSFQKLDKNIQTKGVALYTSDLGKIQETSNIAKINSAIKNKKLGWVAGQTSVSGLTYEQKKSLFKNADGTSIDKLPNLQGFEYYTGGVFTFSPLSKPSAAPLSKLPNSWDWRNVNGENWMTSVKNQGLARTCWAHSNVGALEAQINLYYNQHLDLNLSEQMLADCINQGPITEVSGLPTGCLGSNMCYPGYIYCKSVYHGIADENCDVYAQRDSVAYPTSYCDNTHICSDWAGRIWKITNFHDYKFVNDRGTPNCTKQTMDLSEEDYKKILISKGPLDSGIIPWAHAMVLAGYETDSVTKETIWIYKNSWGTYWGENGYGKIKVTLKDMAWGSLPIGPFIPPTDRSYWPAMFDGAIKCEDKDGDGYYSWGNSEQRPSICPLSNKPEKDCNDSDPYFGPFDENFNCTETNRPSITVISPNGGEAWKTGETHNITWQQKGIDIKKAFYISLQSVSSSYSYGIVNFTDVLGNTIDPKSGAYSWTVPADIPSGVYKIEIGQLSQPSANDRSDSTFTISKSISKTFNNSQIYTNPNSKVPNLRCLGGKCNGTFGSCVRACSGVYYPDNLTAQKICQKKGYETAKSFTTRENHYTKCKNSYLWKWNGTAVEYVSACTINTIINTVTCEKFENPVTIKPQNVLASISSAVQAVFEKIKSFFRK